MNWHFAFSLLFIKIKFKGNPSVELISGILDFIPLKLPSEKFLPDQKFFINLNEKIILKSSILAAITIPNSKSPSEFTDFISPFL